MSSIFGFLGRLALTLLMCALGSVLLIFGADINLAELSTLQLAAFMAGMFMIVMSDLPWRWI